MVLTILCWVHFDSHYYIASCNDFKRYTYLFYYYCYYYRWSQRISRQGWYQMTSAVLCCHVFFPRINRLGRFFLSVSITVYIVIYNNLFLHCLSETSVFLCHSFWFNLHTVGLIASPMFHTSNLFMMFCHIRSSPDLSYYILVIHSNDLIYDNRQWHQIASSSNVHKYPDQYLTE